MCAPATKRADALCRNYCPLPRYSLPLVTSVPPLFRDRDLCRLSLEIPPCRYRVCNANANTHCCFPKGHLYLPEAAGLHPPLHVEHMSARLTDRHLQVKRTAQNKRSQMLFDSSRHLGHISALLHVENKQVPRTGDNKTTRVAWMCPYVTAS